MKNNLFLKKIINAKYLVIFLVILVITTSAITLKTNKKSLPTISVLAGKNLINVKPSKYCDVYFNANDYIQNKEPNCEELPIENSLQIEQIDPNVEISFSLPLAISKDRWGYCFEIKDKKNKLSNSCTFPSKNEIDNHRIVIKKASDEFQITTLEIQVPLYLVTNNKKFIPSKDKVILSRFWQLKNISA